MYLETAGKIPSMGHGKTEKGPKGAYQGKKRLRNQNSKTAFKPKKKNEKRDLTNIPMIIK